MILTYYILSMKHLIAIKYDNIIRNDLGILLEGVQLNIRRVIWYQHDGCSVYYGVTQSNSYTQILVRAVTIIVII